MRGQGRKKVGIRELKTHASEIVDEVREQQAQYVITHRGEPVGLLLPWDEGTVADRKVAARRGDSAWDELEQLGEEIGRRWKSPESSVELLSRMRGER
ncbi:MAG TPA: type II toxin-antitoxin system Phd/YefM family antitoxin [Thermoanaerobaculia bacterium]